MDLKKKILDRVVSGGDDECEIEFSNSINKIMEEHFNSTITYEVTEPNVRTIDIPLFVKPHCNHAFIQQDSNWKTCRHCGSIEPLNIN